MANTSSGYELFNNYDIKTKQALALFIVSYKLMKIALCICRGRPFKIMCESWPDFKEIVNAIVNKCFKSVIICSHQSLIVSKIGGNIKNFII